MGRTENRSEATATCGNMTELVVMLDDPAHTYNALTQDISQFSEVSGQKVTSKPSCLARSQKSPFT